MKKRIFRKWIAFLCVSSLFLVNGYEAKASEVAINEMEEVAQDEVEEDQKYVEDLTKEVSNEVESVVEQEETSVDTLGDECLTYTDTCVSADDIKRYSFMVDFSVSTDVNMAIVRTGNGNVKVTIKDENGNNVKKFYCNDKDEDAVINPKQWAVLNKPENVSDLCTFTAEISTDTNSSFSFSVGNSLELPKMLSGMDKITPIEKYEGFEQAGYTNYVTTRNYFPGKDFADYYSYTATNRNIIELFSMGSTGDDNMEFEIRDRITNKIVYLTSADDATVETVSNTSKIYYVRYDGRDMVQGTEYIIKVYSKNGVSLEKNYNLYAGNPMFRPGYISNISSTSSGTITTKSDKLFTFSVSGAPKGAYATKIYFSPGKSIYRGSYRIIATNGRTYYATEAGSGIYKDSVVIPFDAINYDGGGNAPVNGTWMVWLRSPSGSYTIRPKISIEYKFLSGVEDIY
ncbi:MAG: hypothetical protein HFH10_11845 [Dorea sp.]|nr:hypothetical protein [Dorea sp.]MCI9270698.1 hypothetical protein [Dorea sp.]